MEAVFRKTIQQVSTAQYQRWVDSSSPPAMASEEPTATWTAARVVGRFRPVGSGSAVSLSSLLSIAASSASSSSRERAVAGVSSESSCGPSRATRRPRAARAASPRPRKTSCTAGEACGRFSSSR